jgi:sigma-B regulation protein RsbU (phosphoserine phosphatase)
VNLSKNCNLLVIFNRDCLLEAAPHLPGWEVTAISLPARDLGGDLYDFLPLAQGWQGIMIGDVSGKGLPAALRMAVARTVFPPRSTLPC